MSFIKNLIMLINREIPTKVLIKRGMKCGENFSRQQGCFIDPSHCWLISIGDNVTFSIRVTVLAHDASMKAMVGYARIGKVHIGDNVFVGANATILPGVTIGNNSVIAANSVVTKNVPEGCVVAGNPAKILYDKVTWEEKIVSDFNLSVKFSEEYTMRKNVSDELKAEMLEKMGNSTAYIE